MSLAVKSWGLRQEQQLADPWSCVPSLLPWRCDKYLAPFPASILGMSLSLPSDSHLRVSFQLGRRFRHRGKQTTTNQYEKDSQPKRTMKTGWRQFLKEERENGKAKINRHMLKWFIYTQEWLQLVKNSRKSSWIYLKQNPKQHQNLPNKKLPNNRP